MLGGESVTNDSEGEGLSEQRAVGAFSPSALRSRFGQ